MKILLYSMLGMLGYYFLDAAKCDQDGGGGTRRYSTELSDKEIIMLKKLDENAALRKMVWTFPDKGVPVNQKKKRIINKIR